MNKLKGGHQQVSKYPTRFEAGAAAGGFTLTRLNLMPADAAMLAGISADTVIVKFAATAITRHLTFRAPGAAVVVITKKSPTRNATSVLGGAAPAPAAKVTTPVVAL